MGRFSKGKLLNELRYRAIELGDAHGFDIDKGYSQVEGKGEEVNRAYGEWETLTTLFQQIRDGYI